jgi:hypothetical protein
MRALDETITSGELLDRKMVSPPAGAGPVIFTVPTVATPPITDVGATLTDETSAGSTVRVAVFEEEPYLAVMTGEMVPRTETVFTVNLPDEAPAAIVTEELGRVAAEEELLRLTFIPPVGAGPFRVTVPVTVPPPMTEFGDNATLETIFGSIVSVAVRVSKTPLKSPPLAVIVVVVAEVTPEVVIGMLPDFDPIAMYSPLNTWALELLESIPTK